VLLVASAAPVALAERVTSRLTERSIEAGAETTLLVEVVGECAVDAELLPLPVIDGIRLRVTDGPQHAMRTESRTNEWGEVESQSLHVATWRVVVTADRPGEYRIEPVRVECRSDDELEANPEVLRVRSRIPAGVPIALQIEPERPFVFAGESFRVHVHVEVDRRIHPSPSPSFRFPWKDRVLLPRNRGGTGQLVVDIEDSPRKVVLTRSASSIRRGQHDKVDYAVLDGTLDVVAPEPGVISFEGSEFRERGASGGASAAQMIIASGFAGVATVTVKPIPAQGRPPGFQGAVGALAVSARADRDQLRLGESLELTVEIREAHAGTTNLTHVSFDLRDAFPGFEVVVRETERRDGLQILRLTLTPEHADIRSVPAVTIDWFDPVNERFDHARTAGIPLTVTGPDHAGATDEREGVTGVAPLLLGVGGVVAFGLGMWGVWLMRRRRTPSAASAPDARKRFDRELVDCRVCIASGEPVDRLVEPRILARYVAARLGVDPWRSLDEAELPRTLAAGLTNYLREAERGAFAPARDREVASDSPGSLGNSDRIDRVLQLANELDAYLDSYKDA